MADEVTLSPTKVAARAFAKSTAVTKAITAGVGFMITVVALMTDFDLEPYQEGLIALVNGVIFTYLTWKLPNVTGAKE